MKKLIMIIIVLIGLIGCKRNNVIHTYYGNFNTDTLRIEMFDNDEQPYYQVYIIEKDSFVWNNEVKYLPSPAIIMYNPKKDIYYKLTKDNIGRETISKYNPRTKNLEWLDN